MPQASEGGKECRIYVILAIAHAQYCILCIPGSLNTISVYGPPMYSAAAYVAVMSDKCCLCRRDIADELSKKKLYGESTKKEC